MEKTSRFNARSYTLLLPNERGICGVYLSYVKYFNLWDRWSTKPKINVKSKGPLSK